MSTIRQGPRIRIDAPAKINLFLELHGRRDDGYHELETVMVPISIWDSLIVGSREDSRLNLKCQWAPGIAPRDPLPTSGENLVSKALALLQQHAGVAQGADIWLTKRIPAQAGLGGASTDAAAALVAGNRLWNLGLPLEELVDLAAELGSDVPFFLFDSAALCTGRGEKIQRLQLGGRLSLVVVKPSRGLSTAAVFGVASIADTPVDSKDVIAALRRSDVASIGACLFNRLESAATQLSSEVQHLATVFDSLDVCGRQMSGSGSSYFALCRNRRHSRQVAGRLRTRAIGKVFEVTTP